MHPHGEEALQPVGHGRALHAQQLLRDGRFELRGRLQCRSGLAQEHRTVDLEVVVVRAVQRVEVHRAGPPQVLLIGPDRVAVARHDPPVVPAQHIEMRGHVVQVARVRDQPSQPVGDRKGLLRRRRHLHQVDVHVQYARVIGARPGRQRTVEDVLRLQRARADGGLARAQVPQLPRCEVHQRVRVEGGDVQIVGCELVNGAHGLGIGRVPDGAVLRGLRGRVALAQRLDERALGRRGPAAQRVGPFDGGVRPFHCALQIGVVEELPGLVVVGAQGVRDAPVRHGAVRIGCRRRFEAGDRLFVVERVAPDEAPVEPELRFRRTGRYGPGEGPEVEVVHEDLLQRDATRRQSAPGAQVPIEAIAVGLPR